MQSAQEAIADMARYGGGVDYDDIRNLVAKYAMSVNVVTRILTRMHQVHGDNITKTNWVLLIHQSFKVVPHPTEANQFYIELYAIPARREMPHDAQPYARVLLRYLKYAILGLVDEIPVPA